MIPDFAAALSVLLAVIALSLVRVKDLFASIMLLSAYSGLVSVLLCILGAVDVAFTEAVVGTGVSTALFMALLGRIDPAELDRRPAPRPVALAVALSVGALLAYGAWALPALGDPSATATTYLSLEYVARSLADTETPNVVTAILADYRGFDTLIETTVVFTAAAACLLVRRRTA